ncbi:MAG TPA: hypothetical protein VMW23_08000 [Sedimentisphaerales bacterium]|nr:hypothetical protein [Sedimentisphaerales bacterium]
MQKLFEHIIKAENVSIDGNFRIEPGRPQGQPKPNNVPAQVRIVENTDDFAVVEITCCCGTKTLLKCQYPNAQPSAKQADQQAEQTQ